MLSAARCGGAKEAYIRIQGGDGSSGSAKYERIKVEEAVRMQDSEAQDSTMAAQDIVVLKLKHESA